MEEHFLFYIFMLNERFGLIGKEKIYLNPQSRGYNSDINFALK